MDDETRGREQQRTRLVAERAHTLARLDHLRRDRDEIVATVQLDPPDDEHDPDGATLAWERQQLAALIVTETDRLTAIEDALARLTTGTYGHCEACERRIAPGRLEARPFARRCIDCAT